MDIAIFEPHELYLVLGALRDVALANDAFTPDEAAFLDTVASLHGQAIDVGSLPHVSFADLARALPDPHRRKRALQLAIVTTLIEGQPTESAARAVQELAEALGVAEEGLKVLSRVAHDHALLARLDMVRRVQRFIGVRGGPSILQVTVPALFGLGGDEAVAARYRALEDYPADSLGRALFDHYRAHGFSLPGEKNGLSEAMLFHDVGHVVSGYGTDPRGEIQQAAFQAGFSRQDGFTFLLFGILQFHLGLRITPVAKGERGLFDVAKVVRALGRGAACRVDFSDHFDFFRYAPESLAELRERWGVPPLAAS